MALRLGANTAWFKTLQTQVAATQAIVADLTGDQQLSGAVTQQIQAASDAAQDAAGQAQTAATQAATANETATQVQQQAEDLETRVSVMEETGADYEAFKGTVMTIDAANDAIAAMQTSIDNISLTPGPAGDVGESAYDIARDHGYGGTETQWLATLVGPVGAQGAQGSPGSIGQTGPKGDTGAAGQKGDPGIVTAIAVGAAATASLIVLGGSADVTIPLSRSMPSATYNVEPLRISASLAVGNATVALKSQTKTSVTLTITASVAIASGSILGVVAWQ